MLIQDLYIYPIKSLAGIRLESAEIEIMGFSLDRRWMLVDETNKFMTQRSLPQMALLQVEIGRNELIVRHKNTEAEPLRIPFQLFAEEQLKVQVWDDQVIANAVSSEADSWFSERLEMKCRLVRMPDSGPRAVDPKYAVNDESVSFADAMPYLLISQASLDDLNGRLDQPVPMNRFRPNIVVSGTEAFEEDRWKELRIGEVHLKVTKPCARCVLTTINQDTAEKGKEPLKTLAGYRLINKKILFGQNLLALQTGTVQIGDTVQPIL